MGRGFLGGLVWGLIVVGVALAGVSLFAPLSEPPVAGRAPDPSVTDPGVQVAPQPDRPDAAPVALPPARQPAAVPAAPAQTSTPVELPAGSQFNLPPADTAPVLPTTDAVPEPVISAPPQPVDVSPAPAPDIATAGRPETAIVAPQPAPVPQDQPLPAISATLDPAAPPPEFQPGPLPATEPLSSAADGSEPDATGPGPDAAADAGPEIGPEIGVMEAPSFGTATAGDTPAAQPPVAEGPALLVNAVPFARLDDKPLFSVVLIDTPQSRLERSSLLGFSFPVAFAVDASQPDAAQAAATYRAAGFEVVMLADSLPPLGTPQDLEIGLEGAQRIVPQAVALLDTTGGMLQGNRTMLEPVLDVLIQSGHGFLGYPSGLNTAEATARRTGVPAVTAYRLLDAQQERATVITRYLDRATFTAGQEGHVVVVGHTYADTVTALYEWQRSTRAETVTIAPVSYLLQSVGR